jgi:hypothetical protein
VKVDRQRTAIEQGKGLRSGLGERTKGRTRLAHGHLVLNVRTTYHDGHERPGTGAAPRACPVQGRCIPESLFVREHVQNDR